MKVHTFFKILTVCILFLFTCFFGVSKSGAQSHLGSIRVLVKDFYHGAGLKGAKITISPNQYSGVTDAHGEALITDVLPFRNYQIEATLEGYTRQEAGFVTVEASEEAQVTVPMKQTATISGKVRREGRLLRLFDRPLPDAVVILGQVSEKDGIFKGEEAVFTDRRGDFQFDSVKEGNYAIVALKEGYQRGKITEIEVPAGDSISLDFVLRLKNSDQQGPPEIFITEGLTEEPKERPYTAPDKYFLTVTSKEDFKEFFWIKEAMPKGAESADKSSYLGNPIGSVYSFTSLDLGEYTIALLAIDKEGVTQKSSICFEAINIEPEAVPSIIPGPSELPFIDSNQVYTICKGSSSVPPDSLVYLRGFGIDWNLPSPGEFNPDAPPCDVYGNKNGNFRASLFGYTWSLKDADGVDLSHLLNLIPDTGNAFFKIPYDAKPGKTYQAVLTINDEHGAQSESESVTITVAEVIDESHCAICHSERVQSYRNTMHAKCSESADCQDCHGPGSEHVSGKGNPKLSTSQWSGVCGQCHGEFAELQKANHSDPLSFGYYEPSDGRLVACYPCHYTQGYIKAINSGVPFHKFHFGLETLSEVPKDTPNVSCSVCHDLHFSDDGNSYGLRAKASGSACDTCHYEKWQNALLEGMAGKVGNGYHYPDQDYSVYSGEKNPHRTEKKCVMCHMDTSISAGDGLGVRKVGGHTFRMRGLGEDLIRGTSDDLVSIAVCQKCHEGIGTFDRNGVQTSIKKLLAELSTLLKERNYGFLPANQPGNCAKCHKGGTVPFLDDPDKLLERAYTNYKLILNDRSFGIHNPGYIRKLLQDSINSVHGISPE